MIKNKREIRYCKGHGDYEHSFEPTNNRWRCKACRSEAVQRRRHKLKDMAIELKGGKCNICGYSKSRAAFDFHHLDPTKKDFTLSAKGITRSWVKVKKEIEKCILVCANCHRELHEKQNRTPPPAAYQIRELPNKNCLQKLVWLVPMFRLSRKLHVSIDRLRKECKNLNIDFPTGRYWQRRENYNYDKNFDVEKFIREFEEI